MSIKVSGPDGLEAWGVALAACFINFVMGGLGRISGIFYVVFIELFQIDRQQASIPFALRSLMRNLIGPVVGILGQKYGVPTTTVLGAVIGTVGSAACFYANDMLWFTVLWGAIVGFGTAMTMTLPQVVLGKHFKKHRTTASGIAYSGGCVGAFLFPAILECLLSTYGLGGSFLLMAGLMMNVIPAGMILKEPSWLREKPRKNIEVSTVHREFNNTLQELGESTQNLLSKRPDDRLNNERIVFDKFVNDVHDTYSYTASKEQLFYRTGNSMKVLGIDTQFLKRENKIVMLLITEYSGNCHNRCDRNVYQQLEQLYTVTNEILKGVNNIPKTMSGPGFKNSSSASQNNFENVQCTGDKNELVAVSEDMHAVVRAAKAFMWSHFRNLITDETNNLLNLFHEREHAVIFKVIHQLRQIYRLLEETIETDSTQRVAKENQSPGGNKVIKDCKGDSNTFLSHVKTALRLHANPLFLLISFSRSVHFITFVPLMTIIVDYSMDKGLLQEDGKYVIAALSFGDLFGRMCLGWITDRDYLSLPRYILVIMILQGACTASLTLVNSRAPLLALTSLFGILQGSLFVRHNVLVSMYFGKKEQSVAMGCINFFSGLLGFAIPNYIGYFRDTIGSYDGMFYINGALGTIIGIMWLFEPYFVKCMKSNTVCDEFA